MGWVAAVLSILQQGASQSSANANQGKDTTGGGLGLAAKVADAAKQEQASGGSGAGAGAAAGLQPDTGFYGHMSVGKARKGRDVKCTGTGRK